MLSNRYGRARLWPSFRRGSAAASFSQEPEWISGLVHQTRRAVESAANSSLGRQPQERTDSDSITSPSRPGPVPPRRGGGLEGRYVARSPVLGLMPQAHAILSAPRAFGTDSQHAPPCAVHPL